MAYHEGEYQYRFYILGHNSSYRSIDGISEYLTFVGLSKVDDITYAVFKIKTLEDGDTL